MYYGSTFLDLLYNRSQLQHHDLDSSYLRYLFEQGASLYSSSIPVYPCLLINDCPQFYLLLLEYNCVSIVDKNLFISQLLQSIAIHPENSLIFQQETIDSISICDYFLRIVQLVHYYYRVPQLYSMIEQQFLPILHSQQSSEQVHQLEKQLEQLRSTPLKLREIVRKQIRLSVPIPSEYQFKQIGLVGHQLKYLVEMTFE